MDRLNGSTALHLACEHLTDLIIIETIIDGGADVNAVNSDDKLPIDYVRARMEKDPENYDLLDIEIKLKQKGSKDNWKQVWSKYNVCVCVYRVSLNCETIGCKYEVTKLL